MCVRMDKAVIDGNYTAWNFIKIAAEGVEPAYYGL